MAYAARDIRMKTFRTTILVDEKRRATIQLPDDIVPGTHEIILQLDEPSPRQTPLTFSAHDVGPWPDGFVVRREELYDDSGRGA